MELTEAQKAEADTDKDGVITRKEFRQWMRLQAQNNMNILQLARGQQTGRSSLALGNYYRHAARVRARRPTTRITRAYRPSRTRTVATYARRAPSYRSFRRSYSAYRPRYF